MTGSIGETGGSGEEANASLILEDLHVAVARLDGRIKKTMEALTGKDAGAARSIKAVAQNEYLARRLKARAILMRVQQKVGRSLLAAVLYRRRVSRAKKGEQLFQYSLFENTTTPSRCLYTEAHRRLNCAPGSRNMPACSSL